MRELRRNDHAITNDEAIAILNKAEYGVLSTVSLNRRNNPLACQWYEQWLCQ